MKHPLTGFVLGPQPKQTLHLTSTTMGPTATTGTWLCSASRRTRLSVSSTSSTRDILCRQRFGRRSNQSTKWQLVGCQYLRVWDVKWSLIDEQMLCGMSTCSHNGAHLLVPPVGVGHSLLAVKAAVLTHLHQQTDLERCSVSPGLFLIEAR